MARVIKNGTLSGTALGRTQTLNVDKFADQARKMVADARAESTRIIADAEAQAEQMQEQAEARGYAEGLKKGTADGLAKGTADGLADGAERAFAEAMKNFDEQTAQLRRALQAVAEDLTLRRDGILREARAEVLDLAIEIGRRITGVQAAGNIEVAQKNLAKALEVVSCTHRVQAKVNPGQLDQLAEYAEQFLADMGMADAVQLVGDESLAAGDVVLVSRNGQVDARMAVQIENIVTALTGAAGGDE